MQQVQFYHLLNSLSLAMDFTKSGLVNHHQKVAYLSLQIAEELGLADDTKQHLFCSAIIHDAGTSTWKEKEALECFDVENPWDHCVRGFNLIKSMGTLAPVARIILSHHDRWEGSNNPSGLAGEEIPVESRIIHLADRVDVLTGDGVNILHHKDDICQQVKKYSGTLFDPELVEVFSSLAERESLWLDLTSRFITRHLESYTRGCQMSVTRRELLQVSEIFARIIDGKSPFTHRHSRLVAQIAALLAAEMGFDKQAVEDIKVAGLLHDLGKLSVPDEILEKPGSLNRLEFSLIKQHAYYTYQLLNLIEGFEQINRWASYHHERLNGSGYPFRLEAPDLGLGSRIMAVSDLYSALVEDRPYRPGLPRKRIIEIIDGQVKEGAIDGEVVGVLKEKMDRAEKIAWEMKENNHEETVPG